MSVTPYLFREETPQELEFEINAVLSALLSEKILGIEVDAVRNTPAFSKNIYMALTTDTSGATVITNPYVFKTFAASSDVDAILLATNFTAANPTYFFSPIFAVYRPTVDDPNQSTIVAVIYNTNYADGSANWGYTGTSVSSRGEYDVFNFGAAGLGLSTPLSASEAAQFNADYGVYGLAAVAGD